MSLTYREIKDQYNALVKTFDYIAERKDDILSFYRKANPQSLVCLGSGSSYCLCLSAELTAQIRLGTPTTSFTAGDLMLNYKDYDKVLESSLLLAPSRSGNTSEVLMAVEKSRNIAEIAVLGVVCTENSKMAQIADLTLELPWAFDESVCQTRSVVNLYAANLLILAYLSNDGQLIEDIKTAIETGNKFMSQWEEGLEKVANCDWSNAIVLADGEISGLAGEGALAITEIARVPGRYYHLLDVRHGPMVMIDHNSLAIVGLTEMGFEYQRDLINDLLKKGATVITYSEMPFPALPGVKLQVSSGQKLGAAARGLHFIFLPQILAYYKAKQKKVNPDQPEGLSAWIEL
ncbi:MAG TPA: hypothetical protein DDZ91_01595 [Firmicutes bacterium]|jgi:fructoselysine-6-P-deglycase FrlB-like protein|nr:hypothetical protein [Bacillota bacterium]